jgi:CRISPR-associated endonuclease Cas1
VKASPDLSRSPLVRKSGTLVLSGWGIRIQVRAGHLCTEDGVADERRKFRLPKVGHGLRRLVCIGSEFFITGDALLWLEAQNAAFVNLDRRGKVIVVCGPVSPSDAKLRRAQALAIGNGTALRISKELISQKLTGQELLVRDMLHDCATADAIARFRSTLPNAESIEMVRLSEAQAARLYWHSWADLPILWPRKDEARIPQHWKKFGSRISPITRSPRLATTPANALLNLLYSLLESEARLAATAMGLDVAHGFLHADTPNRDSLACDLMEVCRPGGVDAFVLNWLQSEPLRKSDFWEDRNGNCRIASSLAIKLCETSDTWRRLMAPVAEYVAQEIWSSISRPLPTLARPGIATRLTQRTKRAVKGSDVPSVEAPIAERVCRGCGAATQGGQLCPTCGREVSKEKLIELAKMGRMAAQNLGSRKKRSETQRRHQAANRAWRSAPKSEWPDADAYLHQIQPRLIGVTISALAATLGVSEPYAALVRKGQHRPHPRHWRALADLVGKRFPPTVAATANR